MAVKAKASITIFDVVDIDSTYRYYKLQSSSLSVPAVPTTFSKTEPPEGWTQTEPTYNSGNTDSLYFIDCTLFSDGSFEYTPVSLSSSYEAAKEAYNKSLAAEAAASDAAKTATNFMEFTDDGLMVGNKTSGEWSGSRTRIKADSFDILDPDGALLARYGKDDVYIGAESTDSTIHFCKNLGYIRGIDYGDLSPYNPIVLSLVSESIAIRRPYVLDENNQITQDIGMGLSPYMWRTVDDGAKQAVYKSYMQAIDGDDYSEMYVYADSQGTPGCTMMSGTKNAPTKQSHLELNGGNIHIKSGDAGISGFLWDFVTQNDKTNSTNNDNWNRWFYRVWASGIKECWGRFQLTFPSKAPSTAGGQSYYRFTNFAVMPFTLTRHHSIATHAMYATSTRYAPLSVRIESRPGGDGTDDLTCIVHTGSTSYTSGSVWMSVHIIGE